jgi:hypothetical protein
VGLWLKMLFVCVRLRLIPPLEFKLKNQDVTPKGARAENAGAPGGGEDVV